MKIIMIYGTELMFARKMSLDKNYKNCYSITEREELEQKMNEIMEYNKERQSEKFSLRCKKNLIFSKSIKKTCFF